MREWTLPDGRRLVELSASKAPERRDPLLARQERMMLELARDSVGGEGQPARAPRSFAHFHLLDEGGRVARRYECFAFSDEDDLHGYAYALIEGRLWEFRGTEVDREAMRLKLRLVLDQLRST